MSRFMSVIWPQDSIRCLNCRGTGWISEGHGVRYPVTCPGCHGSGRQKIQKERR